MKKADICSKVNLLPSSYRAVINSTKIKNNSVKGGNFLKLLNKSELYNALKVYITLATFHMVIYSSLLDVYIFYNCRTYVIKYVI